MKKELLLIALIFSSKAQGDYIVVGEQQGISHPFIWGGLVTEKKIVTGYKKKDSQIIQLPRIYPDNFIEGFTISEPKKDKNKGWCRTVYTKSVGGIWGGYLDMAINYVEQNYIGNLNTFYEFKNNKYNEIDVEYLTFHCIKS
jgi:hypothetical protein